MFVDVHAHLNDKKFEKDLMDIMDRAHKAGVGIIITSAYDLASSNENMEIARKFDDVFFTVGIHPENIEEAEEEWSRKLEVLSSNNKVVAIGEIGLDYHFRSDNKTKQQEYFEAQIKLANSLNLPIVVHSRDAIGDTIKILENCKPKKDSLMHCYSGSFQSAQKLMELGFSFSFGGAITFKNADKCVEVLKKLPLERILLETDCPYLSPTPLRGKRNEPQNIPLIAQKIAEIRGISVEMVESVTTENARRIFQYDKF